jgi:hypothetical protein
MQQQFFDEADDPLLAALRLFGDHSLLSLVRSKARTQRRPAILRAVRRNN